MSTTNLSSKSASAGLFAAIVASLCCITPVFSLLAGIGGIAATFSWMEPFRPYLIALTIGVLGFAWYLKLLPAVRHGKPRTQEEIECACETDDLPAGKAGKPSFWQSKKFLGIVTVFAVLMLAFPSYSHVFYPNSNSTGAITGDQDSQIKLAEFKIKRMTCTGCEEHVKNATTALNGVLETNASHEKASAQVRFNASIVSVEAIIEAINKTGYTVTESKVSNWNAENTLFQPTVFNTIELSVKGMTCSGCEAHVTNAIGELVGVDSVKASYQNSNTVVKYDPAKVDKDQIVEAINKTGYKVIEKQN
jgi:mercuric ion transport protein